MGTLLLALSLLVQCKVHKRPAVWKMSYTVFSLHFHSVLCLCMYS